jgi:predicted aconitase with swiveling domain
MDRMMIAARVLNPGTAEGPVLVVEEPLSFWGAFDPLTGLIVDTHHPQRGACLAQKIVIMPETRGSGSASGSIAEAIRRGTAPLALILMKPDVNLAVGSFIAAALYGKSCPVLSVDASDYRRLAAVAHLGIAEDGSIESLMPPSI